MTLDVEALLDKNPQVDRKLLRENEKKIAEAKKLAGNKTEKPVARPYGGSRLISDQEGKDRTRYGIEKRPSERSK